MFIIERYEFVPFMFKRWGIDLDGNSETFDDLPCSEVFKGNIWRLYALCKL